MIAVGVLFIRCKFSRKHVAPSLPKSRLVDLKRRITYFAKLLCSLPCPEDKAETAQAQSQAQEQKSLKQISFPDMDSDGLPSSYAMKVVGCLSKWQIKMQNLGSQLDPSDAAMKPFPGNELGFP